MDRSEYIVVAMTGSFPEQRAENGPISAAHQSLHLQPAPTFDFWYLAMTHWDAKSLYMRYCTYFVRKGTRAEITDLKMQMVSRFKFPGSAGTTSHFIPTAYTTLNSGQ